MKLIYTNKNDKYFNYCHHEYIPSISSSGKLKSDNLLLNSFAYLRYKDKFLPLIEKIQKTIGINNTVWGVKFSKGKLNWEFYFYNYQKKDSLINITNIIKIFQPLFKIDIDYNRSIEDIPYFMFSMDIDQQSLKNKKIDGIHLYINGRSNYFEGFSYFLGKNGLAMENHYDSYYPEREKNELFHKIKKSAFSESNSSRYFQKILIPEFLNCNIICVANKRKSDGIYFSGIDINHFLFFIKTFSYPREIIDFVNINKRKLDYLRYDVAFDYKICKGKFLILKSGYYGTF